MAATITPSSGIQPEIVANAVLQDDREWVSQAENVWFRSRILNIVTGD